MIRYRHGPGDADDAFAIMPITNHDRTKVGFRITRLASTPATGVDVSWEYESAATTHPRPEPYAVRRQMDFAPGDHFIHWFPFDPHEGQLFISVTVEGGLPLEAYDRVDLNDFEVVGV